MSTTRNYTFYKFICLNSDINSCYVGSTGNFTKRKADHKTVCISENHRSYNCKIYQTIRENGGWSNWKMIEIGERENITKRDAEHIEEEYRKELKADMNTHRAFTTPEERKEHVKEYHEKYYENNKEYIKERSKEYSKEYRENNREKLNEKLREKHDCECGGKYTLPHKSEHLRTKKHCENNPEYKTKWYEINRGNLNEKHDCECGGKFTTANEKNHLRTRKHCEYINMSQE